MCGCERENIPIKVIKELKCTCSSNKKKTIANTININNVCTFIEKSGMFHHSS